MLDSLGFGEPRFARIREVRIDRHVGAMIIRTDGAAAQDQDRRDKRGPIARRPPDQARGVSSPADRGGLTAGGAVTGDGA